MENLHSKLLYQTFIDQVIHHLNKSKFQLCSLFLQKHSASAYSFQTSTSAFVKTGFVNAAQLYIIILLRVFFPVIPEGSSG